MKNPERPFINITPIARRLKTEGVWPEFEPTQSGKEPALMSTKEFADFATTFKMERFIP